MADSLFNISMNFVVKHIDFVDSFVDFPSLIGEKLFKKFISDNSGTKNMLNDTLKKFSDAYGNLLLERLNLSKNLLVLNEHFESIVSISLYITHLCVCSCFLGENHDIYSHICDLKCLKNLCLKDNSMTDTSIRLLTLRMRMYKTGGKEIEYLNLADNHFTDSIIPWLSALPKLNYLDISGSNISPKGIRALNSQYFLKHISSNGKHKEIKSEGWASILLEKWMVNMTHKREKNEKKLIYKKSVPSSTKCTLPATSGLALVFQKMPSIEISKEQMQPSVKRIKLSSNFDVRKIEDDIFSLYK